MRQDKTTETNKLVAYKSSYVVIFLRHFSQTAVSIKISYLFLSVVLICRPILDKDHFIENLYIVICIVLFY